MARLRKRLGSGESMTGESRPTESRPTERRPTESRPTESRPTESRPTESRPTESRPTKSTPRVGKGQSNDIPNNATANDNTDETTTKNTTENLNNPSNGRKQVQVVNGLFDKSSECSREITKIFKEKIDDTGGHDKITFINEKSKTIHDNVLRLRQEREGNQASAESQLDETTLYIEAASGAKKRNLYGAGSMRVDYIKDKYSRNETTGTTTVNDGWEKKSMKMERKLNKLNKTLEIVCNRFNITLPDCDSDSENTDGGDDHQGPNTSNSRAGKSNSRAGERVEDDHDSRMIVSS
nr:hypothetical protein [Tanacetum cinerariifolium]